ncbi:MAG: PEP-CTERM sorting domain-containing protein [Planctomycetales bacterium]|nr:PEP-CTERM sorting domain-containing protein [Planctomycetales bacterium]
MKCINVNRLLCGLVLASASALASPSVAATIGVPIRIDIDDADAPGHTESGWTGVPATHTGNGGSAVADGINFQIASADGARYRTSAGSQTNDAPNEITADFAYDDGGENVAVGLLFGSAGDLEAGRWQVEVYIYDWSANLADLTQKVLYREGGAETIVSESVVPHATDPAISFTFYSNGVNSYDVFARENNDGNRSRINGVVLTYLGVPEPSTATGMCLLVGISVSSLRNRRRGF